MSKGILVGKRNEEMQRKISRTEPPVYMHH